MPSKPKSTKSPVRNKRAFHHALLSWFAENGRDLPWRRTEDPWSILVSEVMLQQTTVASVIANQRYEKFLKQFPTIQAISTASEEDLLKAWEGLGYYNRVRNLQKTAQAVIAEDEGQFPRDLASLQKLPGVGPYTSGAVSSFAFNLPAPIVDGNVARLFTRLFDESDPIDSSGGQKKLWDWARELLPRDEARAYNSALMELGQLVCSPRSPQCQACPVRQFCQCTNPESLPVKKSKVKMTAVKEEALFQRSHNGEILLELETGNRRKGFWRLPRINSSEIAPISPIKTVRYSITRYRVELEIFAGHPFHTIPENMAEFPPAQLTDMPIASPERRAIEALLTL